MEAAGFAIGVAGLAGLFSSCIEAVGRAQSYRSFASDSKALDLQFTATKVRLESWGRAVGFPTLEGGTAAAPGQHHPAFDDEQIQKATVEIFGFVQAICESTAPAAGTTLLQRRGTGLDASSSSQPADRPRDGTRRKLAWAMGGKLRRTEQVELFKELVQTLYNLVPPDEYEGGAPVANAWSAEFSQIVARLEGERPPAHVL